MKLFVFVIAVYLLGACQSEKESSAEQTMDSAGSISDTVSVADEPLPNEASTFGDDEEVSPTGTTFTRVFESYIGRYEDLAVLVINDKGKDNDGNTIIEGYYFYEKFQKNLDLHGMKDSATGKYLLTESFKGNITGYMEFVPDQYENSFWSPEKDAEDKQKMKVSLITSGTPYDMNLAIWHGKFEFEHELTFFNDDPMNGDTTRDVLNVSVINDEFMAFRVNVVRTNGHTGLISGVAELNGRKRMRFVRDSQYEYDGCTLDFDLSTPDQITINEIDCTNFHGALASFSGTYTQVE